MEVIYDCMLLPTPNPPELSFDDICCLELSEPYLSTDWLTQEEDEFWNDL